MDWADVVCVAMLVTFIGFMTGCFVGRAELKSLARQEGYEIVENGSREPGHGRIKISIMPRAQFDDYDKGE